MQDAYSNIAILLILSIFLKQNYFLKVSSIFSDSIAAIYLVFFSNIEKPS